MLYNARSETVFYAISTVLIIIDENFVVKFDNDIKAYDDTVSKVEKKNIHNE